MQCLNWQMVHATQELVAMIGLFTINFACNQPWLSMADGYSRTSTIAGCCMAMLPHEACLPSICTNLGLRHACRDKDLEAESPEGSGDDGEGAMAGGRARRGPPSVSASEEELGRPSESDDNDVARTSDDDDEGIVDRSRREPEVHLRPCMRHIFCHVYLHKCTQK